MRGKGLRSDTSIKHAKAERGASLAAFPRGSVGTIIEHQLWIDLWEALMASIAS